MRRIYNYIKMIINDCRVCGIIDYLKINYLRKKNIFVSRQSRVINKRRPSVDIHQSAQLNIEGTLTLNEDYPKKSNKKSVFIMKENSILNIKGHFNAYYDTEICLYPGAELSLGYGYINAGTQIRCMDKIEIGNQCAIGRNVMIMDYDAHQIINIDGSENIMTKPIHIAEHVWIGAGATILKGVTIGENAIVAAGAVVTKDVKANTIVAGCPAKEIRTIAEWR